MDTKEKLIELIVRSFDMNPANLDADASLTSTELDSLSVAELVFLVEDAFHVQLSQDDVDHTTTLNQLVSIVDNRVRAPEAASAGAK